MSGHGTEDPSATISRSRQLRRVDAMLFVAWQAGDPWARSEAWERLQATTISWALPFCRTLASDDLAARELYADGLNDAFLEMDEQVTSGDFRWRGEDQFAGVFTNLLRWRCLGRHRKWLRYWLRIADRGREGNETDDDLEKLIAPSLPAQEDGAIAIAATRQGIEQMVTRLGMHRMLCKNARRKALVAVINQQLEYLRQCCMRSVAPTDTDATTLTLDQLVPLIDRDAVEASSPEMSKFIMSRLRISRNTLDKRKKQIQAIIDKASRAGGSAAV
jgi:hypothetical protein